LAAVEEVVVAKQVAAVEMHFGVQQKRTMLAEGKEPDAYPQKD